RVCPAFPAARAPRYATAPRLSGDNAPTLRVASSQEVERRSGMAAQIGKALDGKVAVVTGASSGIGAASARLFAESGPRVVVGYNKGVDRARAVVGELAGGGQAGFHRA